MGPSGSDQEISAERIWGDPTLRADLRFCMEHGIPYSIYLGRIPDEESPYWSWWDRAWVRAWSEAMADVCPRCGSRHSQWDQDDTAYIGQQRRCMGCWTLEQEQKNIPDKARGYISPYLVLKRFAVVEDFVKTGKG